MNRTGNRFINRKGEKYIKEVAGKWKDKITEQTYQALINYNIEITD